MLNNDFKEFAELLNAKGVDYLVVGGYALATNKRATGRLKDLADLESLDPPDGGD
jgi:hypothetical protein